MNLQNRLNQAGNSVLAGLIVVAVVALIGFTGWRIHEHRKQTKETAQTAASTTTGQASKSDTSNADLQSDLNGIDGSMNQAAQDGDSATNALNDSQNEVSIPIN
ncbi:MAG TPA: hypothetical protein VLG11_06245 [Candidatus Saccharimonadales bacterium]|nr:hypothetical protein [Candidatus Saccharimonadales bacterium]